VQRQQPGSPVQGAEPNPASSIRRGGAGHGRRDAAQMDGPNRETSCGPERLRPTYAQLLALKSKDALRADDQIL
jgi:hypothetical protein